MWVSCWVLKFTWQWVGLDWAANRDPQTTLVYELFQRAHTRNVHTIFCEHVVNFWNKHPARNRILFRKKTF